MDATLRALIVERLDASDLDEDDAARAELLDALGPAPELIPAAAGERDEVYLRSVTVEGFRGIGPAATLPLAAHRGLTVVVGRNGSGKSSFAEGLELLSTGATKRWEDKTRGWTSSWQCLHHDAPTRIAAELVVAGQADAIILEQTWARGVPYTDDAGRADVDQALRTRGWDQALNSFRPFLSYGELASMFDKLTSLYAALSPILGLEDVDTVLGHLADARLGLEAQVKAQKADAKVLMASLDLSDPRQVTLDALLRTRSPQAAEIRGHLHVHPPGAGTADSATAALRAAAAAHVPDDESLLATHEAMHSTAKAVTQLATTDAARALAIAELLALALAARDPFQPADDCPVCRTPAVLDAAWATHAQGEVTALREQAADLDAAERAAARAGGEWAALVARVAAAAEQPAPDAPSVDDVTALAAGARRRVAEAQAQLDLQDTPWRECVIATDMWLTSLAVTETQALRLAALKAAERWLKAEADALRNERFAPIAEKAVANWELLRHESNVELHDITLRSVGKRREASFDVRADGEEANALGVMSQGELLALSVSVFLPRAGLDESPFRFAVIDDPVQSMDPAKVDGLARVLDLAAKTRQVIVFTHDDRLPEAIRRLKLSADVLQVNRRSRSQVSVNPSRTPLVRHLAGAKRMALSERVPEEVRRRVVPTLCRGAVEAACGQLVRARSVADGQPAGAAEAQLRDARALRDQLCLALLGDASKHDELRDELLRRVGLDGPKVVGELNAGAHGDYGGSLLDLHRRTNDFLVALMQSA